MADPYYLQSLGLAGFRAYLQPKTFDFSKKRCLAIFAPNGSGKSSVIDALEFMLDAFDLDGTDGGAFDGTEQHPAKGVADGVPVAGLKGLGDELGVSWAGAFLNLGEFIGKFELSEAFGHGRRLFRLKSSGGKPGRA